MFDKEKALTYGCSVSDPVHDVRIRCIRSWIGLDLDKIAERRSRSNHPDEFDCLESDLSIYKTVSKRCRI